MKRFLLLLLTLALAACASFSAPSMNADQLKALRETSITVVKTEGTGVWGSVKNLYLIIDKGSIPNGAFKIDPDGTVNMNNAAVVRPAPATAGHVEVVVPATIAPVQLVPKEPAK